MSQVSAILRKVAGGYAHWCPACEDMHVLPDSWAFNGNVDKPTFTPSFKHNFNKVVRVNGKWNGEWVRDEKGNLVPITCHYVLTDGILNFCGDCTHAMAGKSVPVPNLPEGITDAC